MGDWIDDFGIDESSDDIHEAMAAKPRSDAAVFLLDCVGGTTDKGGGKAQEELLAAIEEILALMRELALDSLGHCAVAVVLCGTRQAKNELHLDHVYVAQELQDAGAGGVRNVESLTESREWLETEVGFVSEHDGPAAVEALRNGLWVTETLLRSKSSTARLRKQLLVFSGRENPLHDQGDQARDQLLHQARKLTDAAVVTRLFQMRSAAFELAPFWQPALGVEEELLLTDLRDEMRRAWSRPSATMPLVLGPSVELLVEAYAIVRPFGAWKTRQVHVETHQPLEPSTCFIAQDTLLPVDSDSVRAKLLPAVPERLEELVVDEEQLRSIGQRWPVGIHLLGFKPADSLKVGNSLLLYPAENAADGEWQAFIALHDELRRQQRIAICRMVRTKISAPRLVALLPSSDVDWDGDLGGSYSLDFNGIHVIPLPFRDDFRHPEMDPAAMGPNRYVASELQVAAAAALVEEWKINDFDPRDLDDAMLRRKAEVIESRALERPEPPPLEASVDYTDPSQLTQRVPAAVLASLATLVEAFKSAVLPADYVPAAAVGEKRKAAEVEDSTQVAQEILAAHERGQLGTLTLDKLKAYMRAAGLKGLGGKKGDLVARIQQHLDTTK